MNLLRTTVRVAFVASVMHFAACSSREKADDFMPGLVACIDSLRIEAKFQEALADGYTGGPMSKADALHEAKLYVRSYTGSDGRRPFEHPYYWAAFILIGERE